MQTSDPNAPPGAPGPNGGDPDTFGDIAPAETLTDKAASWVEGAIAALPNLVVAIIIVGLAWGLGKLAKKLVISAAEARNRHSLGQVLGGFAFGIMVVMGIALALTVLAPSLSVGDLIGSLGIGSVAIGFAFKDILQNWLAGLLILIRQPFTVGDQIVSGEWEGTVEEIETRATLIRTYDNQLVVVPNGDIYTRPVLVKTHYETRRSQYDVGVGYSTDLERACDIAVRELKACKGVLSDPPPEALPWELAGSGVNIRIRWWTESDRASVVKVNAQVIDRLKTAYSEANIDIPYETRVVLFHDQTDERDGKPGTQFEGWPAPPGGKTVRSRRELRQEASSPKGKRKGKSSRVRETEEDRTTF